MAKNTKFTMPSGGGDVAQSGLPRSAGWRHRKHRRRPRAVSSKAKSKRPPRPAIHSQVQTREKQCTGPRGGLLWRDRAPPFVTVPSGKQPTLPSAHSGLDAAQRGKRARRCPQHGCPRPERPDTGEHVLCGSTCGPAAWAD